MRRWALRIAVFLILGAIVNVAVAWGPFHLASWPLLRLRNGVFTATSWPSGVPDHWPKVDRVTRATLPTWQLTRYAATEYRRDRGTEASANEAFVIDHYDAGWPLLSLHAEAWVEVSGRRSDGDAPISVWRSGLPVDNAFNRLPLQPIWPGFAIDTVLYAGMLWGLFAAPGALRRRLRIRRGLCPKCAYDLRGTATNVCPECGATR